MGKMQKIAKSGKMQKWDFTVFVAESENTVFSVFGKNGIFKKKGVFFEKGILGVFWEGVKNRGICGGGQKRPILGYFPKTLKISILGYFGVFCQIRGFGGYIGEMP